MAWRGVAWRGMAWHGVAWRGVAWHGVAWRGVAWHGVAWHGVAWRGMAWRGVAWRGQVEAELVDLDEEERSGFLEELGVERGETGLEKLIGEAYVRLDKLLANNGAPMPLMLTEVAGITTSERRPERVYMPNHPLADEDGFVYAAAVNVEEEFVERDNLRVGKNINLNFSCNDVVWSPVDDVHSEDFEISTVECSELEVFCERLHYLFLECFIPAAEDIIYPGGGDSSQYSILVIVEESWI